jgi:hypothetical protein
MTVVRLVALPPHEAPQKAASPSRIAFTLDAVRQVAVLLMIKRLGVVACRHLVAVIVRQWLRRSCASGIDPFRVARRQWLVLGHDRHLFGRRAK